MHVINMPLIAYLADLGLDFIPGEIKKTKKLRGALAQIGEFGDIAVRRLRNAVTAEKAETFIAPALKRGGAKPTIAMVWGGGHYGIKRLLQNPEARRKLLAKYNLANWVRVNHSRTFSFHPTKWGNIEELKEHHFEVKPAQKRGEHPRGNFIQRFFRRK